MDLDERRLLLHQDGLLLQQVCDKRGEIALRLIGYAPSADHVAPSAAPEARRDRCRCPNSNRSLAGDPNDVPRPVRKMDVRGRRLGSRFASEPVRILRTRASSRPRGGPAVRSVAMSTSGTGRDTVIAERRYSTRAGAGMHPHLQASCDLLLLGVS
jgi:hypothetical protein